MGRGQNISQFWRGRWGQCLTCSEAKYSSRLPWSMHSRGGRNFHITDITSSLACVEASLLQFIHEQLFSSPCGQRRSCNCSERSEPGTGTPPAGLKQIIGIAPLPQSRYIYRLPICPLVGTGTLPPRLSPESVRALPPEPRADGILARG